MSVLTPARPTSAATAAIVVTTTADVVSRGDGVLSLREAIDLANANRGDDVIVLARAATYRLTRCDTNPNNANSNRDGDLDHRDRTGGLTLRGRGATIVGGTRCPTRILHHLGTGLLELRAVTIRGGRLDNYEQRGSLSGAAVLGEGDVTATKVTLTDNVAFRFNDGNGPWVEGGALSSSGAVNLISSEIGRNEGGEGGGVYGRSVTLSDTWVHDNLGGYAGGVGARDAITVENGSVVEGNQSGGASCFGWGGGGLKADDVTVTGGSVISDNYAQRGSGGGISATTVHLSDVIVRGNRADPNTCGVAGGGGAGIEGETITVVRSTIADNVLNPWSYPPGSSSRAYGAAILGRDVTLVDSTVSGNQALDAGEVAGIRSETSLQVTNSTITGNLVDAGEGAGVSSLGTTTLRHATITDNQGPSAANLHAAGPVEIEHSVIGQGVGGSACAVAGSVVSLGYNVAQEDGTACGVGPGPGDEVGLPDLGLATLTDNGGPTLTQRPSNDWLSIIPIDKCSTATDQRGEPRPQGDHCEAGAVEIP